MADEPSPLDHAATDPASVSRRAELAKIMSEPGWQRGDPVLKARADALYPASGVSIDLLTGQRIDPGAPSPESPGVDLAAVTPEERAETARAVESLRQEWGEEFPAKYDLAQSALRQLAQDHGIDALDDLLADFLASGGTRETALKFLASYGERWRS